MAGKLSPQAQQQISALRTMEDKVQHVHGLVERFAATREPKQAEMLAQPLKRAFGRLKLQLMGAGFDRMSQLAGAMEIAAGRGGNPQAKSRILREGVGSLRFQIEQEQRKVATEDAAQQRRLEAQAQQAGETPANPPSGGGATPAPNEGATATGNEGATPPANEGRTPPGERPAAG